MGHVWGMEQGQQGQQRCRSAGSCALALTSGEGSEQRRSPGHAVYGMRRGQSQVRAAVSHLFFHIVHRPPGRPGRRRNGCSEGRGSLKSPPRSACRSRPWLRSPVPRSAGAFDLGGGQLEAGPDLIGLDLGHRPLLALGVSQLRWRSRPVTMTRSPLDREVGQVLGLAAPDVDLEEGGVAVAPLAVLLDRAG